MHHTNIVSVYMCMPTVWNRTDQERVVLLFDLWHPDLLPSEIAALVDMFAYARRQGWTAGKGKK